MIEFVLVKHYLGGVPQGLNLEWGCLMDVTYLLVFTASTKPLVLMAAMNVYKQFLFQLINR